MPIAVTAAGFIENLQHIWSLLLTFFLQFLPHLLASILVIVAALVLTKLLTKPIQALLSRNRLDNVAIKYIHRAIKIVIWTLAAVIVLDQLGFPISSLLTLLAAVGAAVALAIKDNLANLSSGIVLLFAKPFKAGDFIEVGGAMGTIYEIGLMHTVLDTTGNTRVAIPNSTMMTANITNYSTHAVRRQDLSFSIGYQEDLVKAMDLLQTLLDEHPLVLKDPAPIVRVKEHGASAIILLARFWCAADDYWELQFDLLKQVKLLFDEKGISIPFNQLDVHLCPSPSDEKDTTPEDS